MFQIPGIIVFSQKKYSQHNLDLVQLGHIEERGGTVIYPYPEDAKRRFEEVDKYTNVDNEKCMEGYKRIVKDYENNPGVLAKAYLFMAETAVFLSDFEACEKYCKLGIQCGKESGNIRCQVLCMIKLCGLKIDQHNEAMAVEYLYDSLSLAKKNHDEDLFYIIHAALGCLFSQLEDYHTALLYFQLSLQELLEVHPDSKEHYPFAYGSRLIQIAECYIRLEKRGELQNVYEEFASMSFESVPQAFYVVKDLLKGYIEFLDGKNEDSVEVIRDVMIRYKKLEEVFDTFFVLEIIYQVFEKLKREEDQREVLELLKYYAETTEIDAWKYLYTEKKILFCKQTNEKTGLLEAYDDYYTNQQNFHNNSLKQKQEYIKLRKRLYEEKEEYEKNLADLQLQSGTDELTGLANRRTLFHVADQQLKSAMNQQCYFGVLLIDIDRYKQYNDVYGHIQGDECLRRIGETLKEVFKEGLCARYGGDEFICVFWNIEKDTLKLLANRLKARVEVLGIPHAENPPYEVVTLSQGLFAKVPGREDAFADYLLEADKRLYVSKKNGRNQITIED